LSFFLESWAAAGGPNMYRKVAPSCETSNTERPLAKLQWCSWEWDEQGADRGVLWWQTV